MLFTTDIAGLVAGQLTRFVTLNRHQLAGQVENLNFWLAEVHHALDMIDGYGVRFVRLHAAQERYVATYNVTMSEVGPGGVSERSPAEVRRIPDRGSPKGAASVGRGGIPVSGAVCGGRSVVGGSGIRRTCASKCGTRACHLTKRDVAERGGSSRWLRMIDRAGTI